MRILYVSKVSPRLGGGAELRRREVGKRLARKGHRVFIVCGKTEPDLPDREELDGFKVYYVNTIPRFLFRLKRLSFYLSRYVFAVVSIPKIFRVAKEVDLIVDDIAPSPSLAYLIGRLRGKPVYAIIHEFFGREWFRLKDPITAFFGFTSQYLLKVFKFERFITVSNFTRERLVNFGINPERIFVVHNGIDITTASKAKSVGQRGSHIVTLGRLVRQKGYSYLIDAMRLVISEMPEAKLSFIGDGPMRQYLLERAKGYGIDSNITFHGRVLDKAKFEILEGADIFVHPSLQEGFGITLLEAMACGLPIIANDIPPFREIMNERNGFLINVKDSAGFAKTIINLTQNFEKRKEMGEYNRQYVRRFNWDTVADGEEKVCMGIS